MKEPRRFRVWCLSWEDDEEAGCDVVSFDILGGHPRGQRRVVHVPDTILHDASDAAEAYADYVHGNRDGNESSWPLTFRVRDADGEIADFEVDREYVPEFSASPVKLVPATHVLWGGHVLCKDLWLRHVPRDWPVGQRWISLKDVADGAARPDDGCAACWNKAPGRVKDLLQIGKSA